MKIIWNNSREKKNAHRYIFGAPRLDLQENPDLASDNLIESSDPIGAAGSVSLETDNYSQQVDGVIGEEVKGIGVGAERGHRKRSLKTPAGIALESPFERQWLNVYRWFEQAAFSKNSILKDISNTQSEIGQALRGSVMISTGVKSALYDNSYKATMKAISSGGKRSDLEKSSLNTFYTVKSSITGMFDTLLNDINIEKYLGREMLDANEWLKKLVDLRLWRGTRYTNKAEFLKHHILKARGEVVTSMNYVEDQLKKNIENIEIKIDAYQTGMRNKNDSIREGQFMGFVQSVIQNPAGFLAGGAVGMFRLNDAFGTTNRVKILDAINSKFSGKVIELERSQQLTLDQETYIDNLDRREQLTRNALETDFEGLYSTVEGLNVQTYEDGDDKKYGNEGEALKRITTGLRRLGIDVRRDVLRDAPTEITTSERMTLVMQYMRNHLGVLNDQRCSLDFKRTLYTWLRGAHASQAEQLAQGSQAEDGTPAQREYILNNALVVKRAAYSAIESLADIDAALRNQEPNNINEKFQAMSTFLSSFKEFFGEDGESGSLARIIPKMPRDEQDLMKGMTDFKGLYSQIEEILGRLQTARKEYVDSVLKNLPPSDELLQTERERAQNIADRMSEMVGRDGGLAFSRDDFAALENARSEIFARVKGWDDAQQDLENYHFDLPAREGGFAGMLHIGNGIQEALDALEAREGGRDGAEEDHSFNRLVCQRMQENLQEQKEAQFNQKLEANMTHQMDTLLGRTYKEDGTRTVGHAPEPGITLDRLDVADVTNTDGELVFPDSLENRGMFENLTLLRSGLRTKEEQFVGVDMVFHNDTHIVQVREKNGRVVAESWEKPAAIHGDRNAVVRVPHTQPDAEYVVLNLSTAGTVASTRAIGGRRDVRLAA